MKLVHSPYPEKNLRSRSHQTAGIEHENSGNTAGAELATSRIRRHRIPSFEDLMNLLLFRQSRYTVFVISCITYANTLKGTFLHDDNPAILRNPDVQGKTPFSEVFKNDFWGTSMLSNTSHKSYRPLCVLTFRFEHHIFGFCPVVFHLSNVLLHASVSVMFLVLCKRFVFKVGGWGDDSEREIAANLCGLLFALHPVHAEAVAGIVGRAELLSALFYLASLSSYLKPATFDTNKKHEGKEGPNFGHEGRRETRSLVKSLLFASLSMLFKETGVSVLGIIASLEVFKLYSNFLYNKGKRVIYKSLTRLIIVFSWGLFLLSFRFSIMDWQQPVFAKPDNPASQSTKFQTRFLTYAYLWFVNFKLLLLPGQMLYDWSYGTIPLIISGSDSRNISTLLIIVSAILLSFSIFYNDMLSLNLSPSMFGLLMFILPFLPSSNLFFPVGFVVAERVLYIPSMGFVILYVVLYRNLRHIFPSVKSCLDTFLLITVTYYLVNTIGRNQNWYSKETLFRSGLNVAPNNAKIRYNWANFLRDSEKYHEAAKEYETTLDLYPMYAGALNNLATILEMNPETWARAEELYIRLIRVVWKERGISGSGWIIRLLDYARVITHHCDVQKDTELMNLKHRDTFYVVSAHELVTSC